MTNRTLKVNNHPLFILLYCTKCELHAIFYKGNGKTWPSVLFLGLITFHLYCYSKSKGKRDDTR